MKKNITLDDQDYTLAPITVSAARDAKFRAATGIDFNIALVTASLQAGGDATATEETVGNLPFFGVFPQLLTAACEVNGLKTTATAGESQPEGPADSTLTTSTAQ